MIATDDVASFKHKLLPHITNLRRNDQNEYYKTEFGRPKTKSTSPSSPAFDRRSSALSFQHQSTKAKQSFLGSEGDGSTI